jgi:sRNA-binding regulator protein Hfq
MAESERKVTDVKRESGKRYETGSETIDNFGRQQIGKSVTITMRGGRIESGTLRGYGQYDIALELPNKKILIVMKHAIDAVVVL